LGRKAKYKLTPEQEELQDSGLRILAHIIAEAHLKRVARRRAREREQKQTNPPVEVHDE
jgi:hypothetical protein